MPRSRYSRSLQLGVFRLDAGEYWNIGVGVFPESEKLPVACPGFDFVSHQTICPAQLDVGQSPYRVGEEGPAMIQNFLEFGGRLPALPRFQIRLAAHIRGVKASELGKEPGARQREVVRKR